MTNEQVQAEIHKRIAPLLSKPDQGRVMGEVRAVLAESIIEMEDRFVKACYLEGMPVGKSVRIWEATIGEQK